jgi:hypothetical protein
MGYLLAMQVCRAMLPRERLVDDSRHRGTPALLLWRRWKKRFRKRRRMTMRRKWRSMGRRRTGSAPH